MAARSPQVRRAIAERLSRDPDFKALLISDPSAAEAAIHPEELSSYEIAAADKNCGSVCGCDAAKGVGCEGVNGQNDQGSDCPNKKG